MVDRAAELGLRLLSPMNELAQRRTEDEAGLETLRSFEPATAASAAAGDGMPRVRWAGRRPVPVPPATTAARRAPTWITVLTDAETAAQHRPGGGSTAPGPLAGFDVGIKDLMAVAGCQLTAGTRAFEPGAGGRATAGAEAAAVTALRRAGATIRGTTNLHTLAYGATGKSSDWGIPVNPVVPGAIPGGSSSGSATAVAEGSAALTLGTDTSGSIRIPAALCGVVGLKPTRGLVSVAGCHPLSPALDHIGPLAGSVPVLAAGMAALAGWAGDADDPGWQLPQEPLDTPRLGVLGGYFDQGISAPVREALRQALARLSGAGTELADVTLPLARHIPGAQLAVLGTEALQSNLGTLRERGADLPADVRLRLEAGLARTPEQVATSQLLTQHWRHQVDEALRTCHALVSTTTAISAPPLEATHTRIDGVEVTVQFSMTRLTMPFNFSGHPAITLPFRDTEGTLIGLQLIGRAGGDQDLLALAAYLEQVLG